MHVDDSFQHPFPFLSSPPTPDHPDSPSSVGLVGVTYSSVTLEWIPGFNGGLAQSFRIRSAQTNNDNNTTMMAAAATGGPVTLTVASD